MNLRRKELLFRPFPPGPDAKRILSLTAEEILQLLEGADLRGRGGAGFPVVRKWRAAGAYPADVRYVICNADEGEPGTFKDREILTRVPEKVWLGMGLAARVLGAREGFVYLRYEYRFLVDHLETSLARFHAFLREIGIDFTIRIFLGAGAYVCGEETALIESMEGKRGEPRNKPPFPVEKGYLGRPTVVNNVETFTYAAELAHLGREEFLSSPDNDGLYRLFCLAGDTPKPGIFELGSHMPIADLVVEFGDGHTKAVQIGGASGFCVPQREFRTAIIGQNGLPGGGSILFFNQNRSMYRVLMNFIEFFSDESCGQCTPCRVGGRQLRDGLLAVKAGSKPPSYLDRMLELSLTMQDASKCGLGRSVANSFRTIVTNFREEMIY